MIRRLLLLLATIIRLTIIVIVIIIICQCHHGQVNCQVKIFHESFYSSSANITHRRPTISIGGFFIISNSLPSEHICLKAARKAIQDVNRHRQILPAYDIAFSWANTECSEPLTLNALINMIYPETSLQSSSSSSSDNDDDDDDGVKQPTPPPPLAFVGPICGAECEVTAPVAKMHNAVQISYGCGTAPKEKRMTSLPDAYSNFFRLEPGTSEYNAARLAFLQQFNWQRVFLLYQSGRSSLGFLEDEQSLVNYLRRHNVSVARRENWIDSPAESIARLQADDARIIFFAFSQNYVDKGAQAGCEAYKAKMYGARYVWINIAYLQSYWWRSVWRSTDCTSQQLDTVFDGMFYVGEYADGSPDEKIAGVDKSLKQVVSEMLQQQEQDDDDEIIKKKNNDEITTINNLLFDGNQSLMYVPVCYDNIVITAWALNKTEQQLISSGNKLRLGNFTKKDRKLLADMFVENMRQLEFNGFKGRYRFDALTNEPMFRFIAMYRDYNNTRQAVFWYSGENASQIYYEGDIKWATTFGQAPLDSLVVIVSRQLISDSLYISIAVFAALGLMSTVIYAVVVFRKLGTSEIRMLSPNIVLVMLVGCALIHLSLPMMSNSVETAANYCTTRVMLLSFGLCLLFGGLFAKSFRIFLIFTRVQKNFSIKDWQLVVGIAVWTTVNVAINWLWLYFDPLSVEVDLHATRVESDDTVIQQVTNKCVSRHTKYLFIANASLQGLALLFGSFVSFATRNVKVGSLNDSREIGLCIYVTTIAAILTAVLSFSMSGVNLNFGLTNGIIFIATMLIESVVFARLTRSVVSTALELMPSTKKSSLLSSSVARGVIITASTSGGGDNNNNGNINIHNCNLIINNNDNNNNNSNSIPLLPNNNNKADDEDESQRHTDT